MVGRFRTYKKQKFRTNKLSIKPSTLYINNFKKSIFLNLKEYFLNRKLEISNLGITL
jgi:hypothetical protein